MKKVIKNYLAKLQENDKKGFSLVELIIVMAIMAILVGIVVESGGIKRVRRWLTR